MERQTDEQTDRQTGWLNAHVMKLRVMVILGYGLRR